MKGIKLFKIVSDISLLQNLATPGVLKTGSDIKQTTSKRTHFRIMGKDTPGSTLPFDYQKNNHSNVCLAANSQNKNLQITALSDLFVFILMQSCFFPG